MLKSANLAKSYTDAMLEIKDQYRAAGNPMPATTRQIATWAVAQGLWSMQKDKVVDACMRDLSDAMRTEHHKDHQGRSVRTNHCAKIKVPDEDGKMVQRDLWDDIRRASPEFMMSAFQQRRSQIEGDVVSLRNDLDSYNDNYLPSGYDRIDLCFDFTSKENASP